MAVLAHEHKAQAEHDFALAVGGHRPAANFVADGDVGHVGDANWHAVLGGDDDLPYLLEIVVRPRPCTSNMPPSWLMLPPPTLKLFFSRGLDHFVEGQVVLDQPLGIDADLVLLLIAAPAVDFGHARNRADCGPNDPVVHRAQLARAAAGAVRT